MRLFATVLLLSVGAYAQSQAAQHLFVVNKNGNTLSVVNARTHAIDRTINVGNGPHEVAISPDRTKAYVANAAGNSVSVVDLKTYT
jgi:YVTN family beta-propeller protein